MGCGLSIWVIRTVGCFPRGLYSRRPSRFRDSVSYKIDFTQVVINRDNPAALELKLAEKVKVEILFEILSQNL